MKNNKKAKAIFWSLLTICLVCLVVFLVIVLDRVVVPQIENIDLNALITERAYTRTTDISDYGTYTGTADDEYVQTFIDSFFPPRIEPYFEDVTFVYCVESMDTYGFEAYLEFRIDDPVEFEKYVQTITEEEKWQEFSFDPCFVEYEIRDGLEFNELDPDDDPSVRYISRASIKKILYNAEEQRIIYWALGVYDGGAAKTSKMNAFFDRFGIDPSVYEQQADSPFEITADN